MMDWDKMTDLVHKAMKEGEAFYGSIENAERWVFNFMPHDEEIIRLTGCECLVEDVCQVVANLSDTWDW
jgi:hypothetical protein